MSITLTLAPSLDQRLSAEESTLLITLNQGLPEVFWERWHFLRERSESSNGLTLDEQREREDMIPMLEQWHLTCMESVLKLAQLRGENPHQTARALGLTLTRPAQQAA